MGNHCNDKWLIFPIGLFCNASGRNSEMLDVDQVSDQDVKIIEEELQLVELLPNWETGYRFGQDFTAQMSESAHTRSRVQICEGVSKGSWVKGKQHLKTHRKRTCPCPM